MLTDVMLNAKLLVMLNVKFLFYFFIVVTFRCHVAWPAPTNIAHSPKLQIALLMSSLFLFYAFRVFILV